MILEGLNHDEKELLYNAIPTIGLLVGGADGNMDAEETAWAQRLTEMRSFSGEKMLRPFYEVIEQSYEARLKHVAEGLPSETAARTAALSATLAKINDVLPKLDHKIAQHLYQSFVTYSESMAKATGGILGFASISAEEQKIVALPMIHKV